MKTEKSGDETQLMPSPVQLTQDDASLIDTREMPSPEKLIAAEKAARVNAEYNHAIAYSAAGRHQADAEKLRQELNELKANDQFREANYAFHMQDLGKLEAERDMLEEQLRKAQAQLGAREFNKAFSEELLKEFYATIDENLALESKKAELSADKSMLEEQLKFATEMKDAHRKIATSALFRATASANATEKQTMIIKLFTDRFGSVEDLYTLTALETEPVTKPYNGGIKAIIDEKSTPEPSYSQRAGRLIGRLVSGVGRLLYKK